MVQTCETTNKGVSYPRVAVSSAGGTVTSPADGLSPVWAPAHPTHGNTAGFTL